MSNKQIGYEQIVYKMLDLEEIALLPQEGEGGAEWSSGDRRSKYNEQTDEYIDWNANADHNGFIRLNSDGGKVLAEMTGPGCLWRIWSALPKSGHIKIFLDGAATPTIDLSFCEFFSKKNTPFTWNSLVYYAAGGYNCIVPISYNQSCKIVGYDDFGAYYQFNYTTFAYGSCVETFCGTLSSQDYKALETVDRFFSEKLGQSPYPTMKNSNVLNQTELLLPTGIKTILDYKGQGAIYTIKCKLDVQGTPETLWSMLKQIALHIHFDQETNPSVWAPLCDFFGTACGINPFTTLATGCDTEGWFYCYWFMPFQNGVQLFLSNDGTTAVPIQIQISTCDLTKESSLYGHFHAKWNRNCFNPTRYDRKPDYTILKTSGKGRFLGFMLHVFQQYDNRDLSGFPGEYWWGEGDEKFFVDGEKYPSSFGTGTEDYFGYAWALPDLFSYAYHAQTFNQGGIHDAGNRSLIRCQIVDNIPFHTEFEAAVEKYFNEDFARYGAVAYWYQDKNSIDNYQPYTLKQRTEYYTMHPCSESSNKNQISAITNSDFSTKDLTGWSITGDMMLHAAHIEPSVKIFNKSYCVLTYAANTCNGVVNEVASSKFTITNETIDFLFSATQRRDPESSFVALVSTDDKILASSCGDGKGFKRMVWFVKDYIGKECYFKIIDEGKGGYRTLSVTDINV